MSANTGRQLPAGLLAIILAAGIFGAYLLRSGRLHDDGTDVVIRGFVMDTFVAIRVPAGHEPAARQAMAELQRLERVFDRRDPASEVARVNAGAGGWVPAGPEMVEILTLVEDMAAATGGLFDVTVGPLLDLWGFGTENPAVPEEADLARALELVGGPLLELDRAGGRVRLARPGMVIDLGGVAKGYAIDRAAGCCWIGVSATAWWKWAATSTCSAGGPEAGPGGWEWSIPGTPGECWASFTSGMGPWPLPATTSATSWRAGSGYHHILDPRTGWPGREARLVTVVGLRVGRVDILSTAVFLMGPERGLALLESLPETEGIIVDGEGNVLITSGLRNRHQEPFFED